MIALIIDKVIYEDKYSIKFLEMQFFFFFFFFSLWKQVKYLWI